MARLPTTLALLTLALSRPTGAVEPAVPAAARVTHYDLHAEVRPETKQLRVQARLDVVAPDQDLTTLRLFLHRELVVERAAVDGRPAASRVTADRTPDAPGFSPTAVAVDLELAPPLKAHGSARVELVYAGPISSVVNGVNLISAELTELALYSAWYPLLPSATPFTYDLSVALPAGLTCISDGELVERREEGGRLVCRFHREAPGSDVPLIASGLLKPHRLKTTGFQVEVFAARLTDAAAEDLARVAVEGYADMLARLGAPAAPGRLVVVVSPRKGWGYSRVPLSVIPEAYVLEALAKPDGRFEVMHGNLHEVAHFWWQMADSATSDDWINESLAEFMALHTCERLFGAGTAAEVRKAYEKDVRGLAPPATIVETRRSDPNGYVLFYEKGALLWERLRGLLGDDALFRVLHRIHGAYRGTRGLTTQALVEAFSKETAGRTDPFFAEWLRGTTLPTAAAQ